MAELGCEWGAVGKLELEALRPKAKQAMGRSNLFFELTELASDGQPRMVVSNLTIRLRILTCSCMA